MADWRRAGQPRHASRPGQCAEEFPPRLHTDRDSGTLHAAFDGTQGGFRHSRTNSEITVALKTSGDYQQIKRGVVSRKPPAVMSGA